MAKPPNNLPRYRVLTGQDDEEFCRRVSDALELGYVLYGGPALTVNDGETILAQALLWPEGPLGGHTLGFIAPGSSSIVS